MKNFIKTISKLRLRHLIPFFFSLISEYCMVFLLIHQYQNWEKMFSHTPIASLIITVLFLIFGLIGLYMMIHLNPLKMVRQERKYYNS